MNTTQSRSKRISYIAVLTTLALIFSYIEAILPFSIGIPGVKLGIANIVVLISLYTLDAKAALTINLIRIFLAGFLFSGVFGIIYSLAGGLLSFAVMLVLKKTDIFSVIGLSVAGGVMHNLGQLVTAAAIVENFAMFIYFPVLLFSGIVCGIIVGAACALVLAHLPSGILASHPNS